MIARKVALSILFVALLVVPTVFGAVPLRIYTPLGTVALDAEVAEARARNTNNNRLRNLRVPTDNTGFTQRFAPNRHTYTINVRENISRVQIQPTRGNNNQSVRHIIDTRRNNGSWNTGTWTRWRSGNSANNRINVNINQQQERRLRVAVRDRAGNVRTYSVQLRRASTNTFASNLTANNGATLARAFNRNNNEHTVNVPANRASTRITMNRAQHNAQTRVRVGNGNWTNWSRANLNRTVNLNQGQSQRIQFQIRGAFSNVAASPTRTRTYTINVTRARAQVTTPAPTQPQGQQRTLTFNSQGGSAVAARNFTSGQALGALPTPTRAGFSFVGWFTQASGGEQITAQTVRTQNLTVHARWGAATTGDGWVQRGSLRLNPQRNTFEFAATASWNEARELFTLVNQHRASMGLPPATFSPEASQGAMQRAAESHIFMHPSHNRPDGSHWASAFNVGVAGEIVTGNGGSPMTPNVALQNWLNSPGHRQIVESYGEIGMGVGFVRTPYGSAAVIVGTPNMPLAAQWPTTGQRTFLIPFSVAHWNTTRNATVQGHFSAWHPNARQVIEQALR